LVSIMHRERIITQVCYTSGLQKRIERSDFLVYGEKRDIFEKNTSSQT
jgi:hypothetical protein